MLSSLHSPLKGKAPDLIRRLFVYIYLCAQRAKKRLCVFLARPESHGPICVSYSSSPCRMQNSLHRRKKKTVPRKTLVCVLPTIRVPDTQGPRSLDSHAGSPFVNCQKVLALSRHLSMRNCRGFVKGIIPKTWVDDPACACYIRKVPRVHPSLLCALGFAVLCVETCGGAVEFRFRVKFEFRKLSSLKRACGAFRPMR